MGSQSNPLEGARAALNNARVFTSSVTGGKPSAFAPKSQASPSNYSHVRAARKSPSEFLGTSGDASTAKAASENADRTREAIKAVQ